MPTLHKKAVLISVLLLNYILYFMIYIFNLMLSNSNQVGVARNNK